MPPVGPINTVLSPLTTNVVAPPADSFQMPEVPHISRKVMGNVSLRAIATSAAFAATSFMVSAAQAINMDAPSYHDNHLKDVVIIPPKSGTEYSNYLIGIGLMVGTLLIAAMFTHLLVALTNHHQSKKKEGKKSSAQRPPIQILQTLKRLTHNMALGGDVDLTSVAARTKDFSDNDLSLLVKRAGLYAREADRRMTFGNLAENWIPPATEEVTVYQIHFMRALRQMAQERVPAYSATYDRPSVAFLLRKERN